MGMCTWLRGSLFLLEVFVSSKQGENDEGETDRCQIAGCTARSPYSTVVSLQRDVVIK